MRSDTRPMARLRWRESSRPDESLKLLAGAGASPRQMLWGLWWCHTLPSLCKSAAAVGCAGFLARLLGGLLSLLVSSA
jgi:hypothetical protein